jgi:hypothetical protein
MCRSCIVRHIKWNGHRNGAGHDGFVRGEERPEEFGLCLYGVPWRENCVSWGEDQLGLGDISLVSKY